MTMRDNDYGTSHNRRDDEVDVAPGVPTDRVRWGPIVAGTFTALTALAVLTTLGAAIGLSTYDQGQDNARNFAIGGGVWGLLSTIIAFALGGWLTARVAALRGRDNGLLNGMMVAAFALPLLMFLIGSASTLMAHAEVANNHDAQARSSGGATSVDPGQAVSAAARMGGDGTSSAGSASGSSGGSQASPQDREQARRNASRTAWGTLIGMLLALGASSMGGYAGSRRTDDDDHHRRQRHSGHAGTTTPSQSMT
ncbi:MAG TPA: hypothetical protein VF669_05980 [Tepidisphaeraceae bacterium]